MLRGSFISLGPLLVHPDAGPWPVQGPPAGSYVLPASGCERPAAHSDCAAQLALKLGSAACDQSVVSALELGSAACGQSVASALELGSAACGQSVDSALELRSAACQFEW